MTGNTFLDGVEFAGGVARGHTGFRLFFFLCGVEVKMVDSGLPPDETVGGAGYRIVGSVNNLEEKQVRPTPAPSISMASPPERARPSSPVYWRVEGSLLELTTVRPIAFFTWNSQTFIARAVRRSLVLVMALLRPFLYAANRVAATRIVHAVLRGITRDRLDLLGEEEFEYKLKPLLKEEGVRQLKALQATGVDVVLVSQGLEHVMRPLARHLGVRWIIANRLDFRDGVATGRLLSPVIRPRGLFARIREAGPDGQQSPARWVRALGLRGPKALASAIVPAVRVEAPRDADRRHRIYRQGLAGQYADGSSGDWETLFADPAAEVESGTEAL